MSKSLDPKLNAPVHRLRALVPARAGAQHPLYRRREIRRRRAGPTGCSDEIAFAQRGDKAVAAEEFQVWKLAVNPDRPPS